MKIALWVRFAFEIYFNDTIFYKTTSAKSLSCLTYRFLTGQRCHVIPVQSIPLPLWKPTCEAKKKKRALTNRLGWAVCIVPRCGVLYDKLQCSMPALNASSPNPAAPGCYVRPADPAMIFVLPPCRLSNPEGLQPGDYLASYPWERQATLKLTT